MFVTLIVILSATQVYAAPPKSLAGLWVATENDTVYWLRLTVSSNDPVALIEDVTGTLTSRSAGPTTPTTEPPTADVPVTGQYLPGSRTVILNIGEPGSRRRYAIGAGPENRSNPMMLRLFQVRPALGINFEREIWFRYKSPLPQPANLVTNP
jgi:hypothetical protein